MNYFFSKTLLIILTSILCISNLVFAQESPAFRIFPPANGEIRLENLFGDIEVVVWQESYLGVSTSVLPSNIKTSPLALERSENDLFIKVSGNISETRFPIALKLKVPVNSKLQISTDKGIINVDGLPSALSIRSVSGDINFNLPDKSHVSLTAHSTNGSVISIENREIKKRYQAVLGAGTSPVSLSSDTGIIRLSSTNKAMPSQEETRLPPVIQNNSSIVPRANASKKQQSVATPIEVDEEEVIKVETDLVTINASVVERSTGRVITGLDQADFKLEEDGVEQKIEHFETVNAPFDLLLLIDLSGSTAKVADIIRAATRRFVSVTRPQDRVAIIAFSGTTSLVSPFTSNKSALISAVDAMQSPQGDTKLYDGINYAFDYVEKESISTRRKAIIVMSDGLDSNLPNVTGTGSNLTYKTIYNRAQEFDGMIYCIWTNTEYIALSDLDIQLETFDLAYDQLYDLSEAGSGLFYEVEKLEDLGGIYEKVVSDLGTVYSLSFNPTNKGRDGRLRQVRLRLPHKPNAVARTKKSYTR